MSEHLNDTACRRESVIIPPDQHPVREEDIDQDALMVLYRLKDAGYSGYLVGGGVRDLYLGKKPKDFDISTDARPGQLRKLFRNSRTIGRRFRLVQVFFRDNKIIEVSTLRSQSEYDEDGGPDEVLPSNNTFGTLEEDACRRDLTINSLFYEVEHKTVIDYVGGVQDLQDRIIRLVGDPDRRITRDPVRMLRAVRHAARAGFKIEEATWQAIIRHRDKLELCPTSRIRDELLKDLQGGASRAWAELTLQSGLFHLLFPFYEELLTGSQGETVKQEMLALLGVADRLIHEGRKLGKISLDEALLFALPLQPWVKRRFSLSQEDIKGAGHHQTVKAVRAALDKAFSRRLNLTKMTLENITTLVVNSPVFQKGAMPAGLRRKSYFAACSRFAACCREAEGGEPADLSMFAITAEPQKQASRPAPSAQKAIFLSPQSNGKKNGGGYSPAFSSRPEGVFGLRREGRNLTLS
ncbi:Poly(A) polymerase I [Candidatus Electronema halotolerans]